MQWMELLQTTGHSSKVLDEYICPGCGHAVKEIEMLMPFGPQKGQVVRTLANCTCETLQLSKKITEELKEDRRKKVFAINSIVSEELKRARFDNYKPDREFPSQLEALQKARQYATDFQLDKQQNIIFTGPYGVGKSHLAYSITREIFRNGSSCIFTNVPKLLTRIKESYRQQSKYAEADLLDALVKVDFLVLDEIGRGYDPNGWAENKLFEIIDERMGRNTAYTSNFNAKQLEELIGGHNVSRIFKNTENYRIKIEGRDRRVSA